MCLFRIPSLLIISILFFNCQPSEKKPESNNNFAAGFTISEENGIRKLTVFNPWEKARNIKVDYCLIDKSAEIPADLNGKNIIRTPVENIICLSTTHIAFLRALDVTRSVTGISGGIYVSDPEIIDGLENERIVDVGYGQNLNFEEIISRKPDVVMVYGIDTEITGFLNKFSDLGIPAILNAEYLETSPLGKAEWIKFVGELYDKRALADSIFNATAQRYLTLKEKIEEKSAKPKVMFGLPYRDAWWVPGGESYMAQLVNDAGGQYLGEQNRSRESFVISFEEAYMWAEEADIWLNTGMIISKDEILSVDERFSKFKVFNQGKIFNNNKLTTPYGGNDFWESGVVRPDEVLADLIQIFHPRQISKRNMRYYKEIK